MLFVWLLKLCVAAKELWGHITVVCKRVSVRPKRLLLLPIKNARIFYHLWTSENIYSDTGINVYEQQDQDRMLKNLKKKAQAFGLQLLPIPNATECVF
jgi:hypothetical protein